MHGPEYEIKTHRVNSYIPRGVDFVDHQEQLAGPQITWDTDANIKSKCYYKLGRLDGESTTNAANGQVEGISFYAEKQVKAKHSFLDDGTPKENENNTRRR